MLASRFFWRKDMLWLESKFKTTSENLGRTIEMIELNSEHSFAVFDSEDFKNFFSEHPELNDLIEPELREKFEDISELRLYFEVSNESRDEIHRLSKLLGLEAELGIIDDEDYLHKWEEYYRPLEIGERLLLVPSGCETPETKRLVVRLSPGLLFGSGQHATTQLMLRLMERQIKKQSFCIDIGCGSGILGLSALALGAGYCYFCDIDPLAEAAVSQNLSYNGVLPHAYNIKIGNILEDEELLLSLGRGYDAVLSNIVADVIIPLLPKVKKTLSKNGVFICSGIIDNRRDDVMEQIAANGYEIVEELSEGPWSAFCLKIKA